MECNWIFWTAYVAGGFMTFCYLAYLQGRGKINGKLFDLMPYLGLLIIWPVMFIFLILFFNIINAYKFFDELGSNVKKYALRKGME